MMTGLDWYILQVVLSPHQPSPLQKKKKREREREHY